MNHIDEAGCRRALEELAALWPSVDVPPALAQRLEACPACRAERASFESLCAKSSSWSAALPAGRWQALAQATRQALPAQRVVARPIVWVTAAAFAAAVVAVLFNYRVPDVAVQRSKPAAALPPPEVLANQEMLENLDLLKEWNGVKAVDRGLL